MSINMITITGRLGQKPIARQFPSGSQVADFSLAHTRFERGRNGGEPVKHTDWYTCEAWDRLADKLCEASKGQEVTIVGRISLDKVHSETKGHEVTLARIKVEQFTLGALPAGQPQE